MSIQPHLYNFKQHVWFYISDFDIAGSLEAREGEVRDIRWDDEHKEYLYEILADSCWLWRVHESAIRPNEAAVHDLVRDCAELWLDRGNAIIRRAQAVYDRETRWLEEHSESEI